MTLWCERQVKRDLGIVDNRRKHQSFDKLFKTPPHVEYTAREPNTAGRLRRLMGTNTVELTNCAYMDNLEQQTIRIYHEDLQERIDERARQAAQLAHLKLWESVLSGQCTIPPNKLEDPCMRQVRQHQLKIREIQRTADKLGTSVLRIVTMPHMWTEPSIYKPPAKKQPPRSYTMLRRRPAPTVAAAGDHSTTAVSDSFHSRRMLVKWSDEARALRAKSTSSTRSYAYQYRKLTGGVSDLEIELPPRHLAEKGKRVTICQDSPAHRERRYSSPQRDRRYSRITPPSRPPVVFPQVGPPMCLLSCDIDGGRVVMKPLGTSDFIIPVYYRPKAPDKLRQAKDLDELYSVSNSFFYGPYPSMDNRDWNVVFSNRVEKKLQQNEAEQNKYTVKTYLVK